MFEHDNDYKEFGYELDMQERYASVLARLQGDLKALGTPIHHLPCTRKTSKKDRTLMGKQTSVVYLIECVTENLRKSESRTQELGKLLLAKIGLKAKAGQQSN